MTRAHRSIMPNVNGSTFQKKLLIINAMISIIFYGIIIRYEQALKKKENIKSNREITPSNEDLTMLRLQSMLGSFIFRYNIRDTTNNNVNKRKRK